MASDSHHSPQYLEIGDNQLQYRKIIIQIAKKQNIATRSSRVGKGICQIELHCDPHTMESIKTEANQKLEEKQEKWKLRGLPPPEEAKWQRQEVEEAEREYRDLIVKRARSKRFRARTGNLEPNGCFVEVLCHPEQMEQLKESAQEILREREWDKNANNPDISLYLRTSANPLKTDDEAYEDQLKFLATLVQEFKKAQDLFKTDPDENYYTLNIAAKNLYREMKNLTREGRVIRITLNNGATRYSRWMGQRYDMTKFRCSGERLPAPWTITDSLDLHDIQAVSL